ncbi:MAG: choice-of-anchor Q domain-containing protein [Bacteroidota bacterium]
MLKQTEVVNNSSGSGGTDSPTIERFTSGGDGGNGGAIYLSGGELHVYDAFFQSNRTGRGASAFGSGGNGGNGGAIRANGSTIEIVRTTFQENASGSGASSFVSGNGGRGGALWLSGGTTRLTRVRLLSNQTGSGGEGGFDDNTGGDGGDGAWIGTRSLHVNESTFSNNRTGDGRGPGDLNGGNGGTGGGLFFSGTSLHVVASTFSDNLTGNGGNTNDIMGTGGEGGSGGGLYASGTVTSGRIESSTFSRNTTGSGGDGGGPPAEDGQSGHGGALFLGSSLLIRSSTIVGNHVSERASGVPTLASGGGLHTATTARLNSTLIVGNTNGPDADDCSTGILGQYLLTSTGTGCTTDAPGTRFVVPEDLFTIVLDPLRDNGGPTLTHALLPGSPAIDSGTCALGTTDQRGLPRPVDVIGTPNATNGCDIGAVESQTGTVIPDTEPDPAPPMGLALTVAPNPAQGPASVTLRTEADALVTVEVLDVRGRRLRVLHRGAAPSGGDLVLSAGGLPVGVYLIRATTEAGAVTTRLTVVR